MQAAWSLAWRRLPSLRESDRLRPWLISIAANQARDALRHARRRPVVELEVADGDARSAADPAGRAGDIDLRNAMAKLDPTDRALVALRYVAGLDSFELARGLGMSASGTRARSPESSNDCERSSAMTDLTAFEQRLSERFAAELTGAIAPFDPAAIARTAIARRTVRHRLLDRPALGPLPMATARKAALVAVVALLALVTITLAIGALRPGGGRLAFVRPNGDVVLAAFDGSDRSVIARVPPPVRFTQLEWAPGGRHLAIADEDLRLTVFDETGDVTFVRTLAHGTARFEWSPDGRRLAIFDGPSRGSQDRCGPLVAPRLDVVALDGGGVWTATLPESLVYPEGLGELTWSPDGRRLAIVGSTDSCTPEDNATSSIWLVSVEGATVRQLEPGRPARGRLPADLAAGRPPALLALGPRLAGGRSLDRSDVTGPRHRARMRRLRRVGHHRGRLAGRRAPRAPALREGSPRVRPGDRRRDRGQAGARGQRPLSPVLWAPGGRAILIDFAPTFEGPRSVVAVDVATGRMREVVSDAGFFAIAD